MNPRVFDNSRTDFGLSYGLHTVTSLGSRFYFGVSSGLSNYTFNDSAKIEPYVYNGIFYSYNYGFEVKLRKSNLIVFIEYYAKRIPTRGDGTNAYEDSFELQQANIERWIIGTGYRF